MKYKAAVITISDKGARGEREDTSGPALVDALVQNDYEVIYQSIIPDEQKRIQEELIACCDDTKVCLVLTTGGTGFSKRDITPEATAQVIERETPGLAEAMRIKSMEITPRGMLSRGKAGIRGNSVIVNLPGSKKAALECFDAISAPLKHGIDILLGSAVECADVAECATECADVTECADASHTKTGSVVAVCVSEKKGEQKHALPSIHLKPNHGIVGDAHAGEWHRQVSLLGVESVSKIQQAVDFTLEHGAFAENILTKGFALFELPVGTKLSIGKVLAEVTQIGKECHKGCAIRKAAGDCVMPREGIFVKILTEGVVKPGDAILVH